MGLRAIVGAVCHGPSGLLQAKETNGDPLVHNKRVNSFTNRETQQIELIGVEPFLLETRLRDAGACSSVVITSFPMLFGTDV